MVVKLSEELVITGVVVLSTVIINELVRRENEKTKRRRRSVWMKPRIRRRESYGTASRLLKKLKNEDITAYRINLRITGAHFDNLRGMVDRMLKKKYPVMKMAIPVATKLEITLLYLATGD